MNSPLRIPLIVSGMLLMVGLGYAAQHLLHSRARPADVGLALTILRPPQSLAEFSLVDDQGQRFDRSRLRGHWTFLFFGYTHCPDVCPSAMQTMKALQTQVGGKDKNVQYVFVSVDPERDKPEKLGQYVRYFNNEFVGITGEQTELERLTKSLGVYYERVGNDSNYQVNHSAAMFLVGPGADFRALLPQPHSVRAIATEFVRLRQQ